MDENGIPGGRGVENVSSKPTINYPESKFCKVLQNNLNVTFPLKCL